MIYSKLISKNVLHQVLVMKINDKFKENNVLQIIIDDNEKESKEKRSQSKRIVSAKKTQSSK